MAVFPVSLKKRENLKKLLDRLGILEQDLEETFIHSSGPGGQNVNKVATCVVLKHFPSGRSVKCQKNRSQAMNRYEARKILAEQIESEIRGRESAKARRISKLKRQKRRRSKRAKEKILKMKKAQSEKKTRRRAVKPEDD